MNTSDEWQATGAKPPEPASCSPLPAFGWLLRTHDSFYPAGGYAHSMGLEPLVQADLVRDVTGLRSFLHMLALPSLCRLEIPFFAAAWHAAGLPDPWPEWERLAGLHHASRSPAELRQASIRTGRQRLQMTSELRPDGWCAQCLARFDAREVPTSYPVAAALDARDGGAGLLSAAAAFTYASLLGHVAAAGKLLRLGQRAMQRELLDVLEAGWPRIEEAAATPVEDAGWTVPWWDLHCCRHESADSRLFLS